jgi:WD40 repeat protein
VTALAAAEVDGRSILLAAGRYGVDAWDPATGTPMSHLPTDDLNPVYALATAAIDGRSHLVTAHRDSTVRVRDLATGMPTGRPLTGHDGWVTAVATARVDGRPVAVTGSYGSHGTLRLWELTDPRPGGEVIAGHDGWVGAVVATTVSERPILAVAYVNRPAVHVYDLMSRRSSRVATGLDHPVTVLAATAHGHLVVGVGRDVAVLIPD